MISQRKGSSVNVYRYKYACHWIIPFYLSKSPLLYRYTNHYGSFLTCSFTSSFWFSYGTIQYYVKHRALELSKHVHGYSHLHYCRSTFIHFNSTPSHRHSSMKLYGLQANKLSTQNITPAGGPSRPSAVTYIVRLEKAMPPSNMVPYRRFFFKGVNFHKLLENRFSWKFFLQITPTEHDLNHKWLV